MADAGRQTGRKRGEALEMKRRQAARCTAVLLPLQLAPRLIRMGESAHGGGGGGGEPRMEPTPFSAAPVVRNAALRSSSHALQNSAV